MLVAEMAPGLTRGFILGRAGTDDGLDALDGDDRVEPGTRRVHADAIRNRIEALFLDDLRGR